MKKITISAHHKEALEKQLANLTIAATLATVSMAVAALADNLTEARKEEGSNSAA